MAIKHTFVSQKSDGADETLVRPSDWNADHTGDATPEVHGNTKHSSTYIVQADAVIPNAPITGATKTKLTYDVKGLVTAGEDAVKADIGLGNVDNTADIDKPVSTVQQTALDLKGNITSQTFVTPNIGVATATSINKVTITAPTTSAILTLIQGSSLITAGAYALTLTSTAASNATFPAGTKTLLATDGSIGALTGTILSSVLGNSTVYIGTTGILLNRASGALTLAGITLTTPVIGAATGTSVVLTGAITSSGAGIGYATGAGGTVTQGTSRATGVTLNKLCGNITMFSAAVAAQAVSTFTLTNSFIAATDMIVIQHISTTNGGAWNFSVVAAAGSAAITVRNVTTASITEATPLKFVVIKAVTS